MLTRCRPVSGVEVEDSAGAEGAVVLTGGPEARGPLVPVLQAPQGAAVRRCRGDEVVQEEVEGQDGAGEAQDEQEQELEPGEAADVVQDLLKPHGDQTEEPRLRASGL